MGRRRLVPARDPAAQRRSGPTPVRMTRTCRPTSPVAAHLAGPVPAPTRPCALAVPAPCRTRACSVRARRPRRRRPRRPWSARARPPRRVAASAPSTVPAASGRPPATGAGTSRRVRWTPGSGRVLTRPRDSSRSRRGTGSGRDPAHHLPTHLPTHPADPPCLPGRPVGGRLSEAGERGDGRALAGDHAGAGAGSTAAAPRRREAAERGVVREPLVPGRMASDRWHAPAPRI